MINVVGVTFQNVTISGASGGNIVLLCARCGNTFDATGGGDGTFSVRDNRLVRVRNMRDRLRVIDPATVSPEELARAIEDADGRLIAVATWIRSHPEIAVNAIVSLVVTGLGVFLARAIEPEPPAPPPGITEQQMQVQQG